MVPSPMNTGAHGPDPPQFCTNVIINTNPLLRKYDIFVVHAVHTNNIQDMR